MDKCLLPSPDSHLRHTQPCGPGPAAAVCPTGIKRCIAGFLWITARLCQNYPQCCARAVVDGKIWVKSACSAMPISAISYLFNSVYQILMAFRLRAIATAPGRRPPRWPPPAPRRCGWRACRRCFLSTGRPGRGIAAAPAPESAGLPARSSPEARAGRPHNPARG